MTFRGDDRGASVQIGAVLLFAILILAVSLWQAQVVPQQNASVEYTHNQRVVDDMKDVRSVMVSAPGERTLRSVSVDMAPAYPPRSVFVNPGPPSGTLRTVGTGNASLNVTVDNATALDDEADDLWDGTPRAYNTGGMAYEPGYNVYTSAPDTVYENTVLYNVQDGGTVVNVSGQNVVDGRTITLVVLNGSLSRTTSDAYSVDFEALSTSDTTLTVTNATGDGNVTVSFASRRGAGWWTAALAESGELTPDGNVTDVRAEPLGDGFFEVTLELEGNETYELRMAKVGVGSGADEPGTAYAIAVSGDGTTVQQGNTRQLVVEVRDAYNNPVSGVTVRNSSGSLQGSLTRENRTTGSDGRVTFEYNAPNKATTETIQFNVSDDASVSGRELVKFTVSVASSGGSGGSLGDLSYNGDAVPRDGPDTGSETGGVNFTVKNNFEQAVTITNVTVDPVSSSIDLMADSSSESGAPMHSEVYIQADQNDGYVDVSEILFTYGTDGTYLPEEFDMDTTGSEQNGNPTASANTNFTFSLFEFYELSGSTATNIAMNGEDLEITLNYRLENGLIGEKTVTMTVVGDTPPSIGTFNVVDNSRCTGGDNCSGQDEAKYDISWSVSDPDGDLSSFTVYVNKSGTPVATYTEASYGFTDSETYTENGAYGDTYVVKIIAKDSNGNTACKTTGTDTADGTDPSTGTC
jgi:hypothetical protein